MALINGINGVYDTEAKRYIYGADPVPPAASVSEDTGKNEKQERPASDNSSVNSSKVETAEIVNIEETDAIVNCEADTTVGCNAKAHVNDVVIRPEALMDKPVHELPTDYLMAEVSEIADIIALVMDCSEDIVISTMFAVVGGAVGTKVRVYDGKYTNMLNVNVCHVAPPGSNKTQPVSLLVKPLENISLQMHLAYKEEKQRCMELKDTANIPNPQILYVSNPTPEAINKMLAWNPHGLFARRDELVGFIEDLGGRYSNGSGGIPDFLSIFTNEHISIIRAGDEPLIIPKPYLTVVGGIQPGILSSILGKEQMINSGFNYRWLFVAPEIRITLERSLVGINQTVLDYWEQLIVKYHNIAPITFTFDDEAQLLLNDYFREIRMKKCEGNDVYMDEVRDKLFIYLEKWAALATLLHGDEIEFFGNVPKAEMGDHFVNNMPCQPVITAEAVAYSIRCMHVFEGWAEKVHGMMQAQDAPRQITLGDAIRTLHRFHPITNKTKFAEGCGMTREQLYKYLPKANKPISSSEGLVSDTVVTPKSSTTAYEQDN